MHDITKLLIAKKFRLKIELEVHATTIKVLRELVKDKEVTKLIEKGYREFISLANDLAEAKRQAHQGTVLYRYSIHARTLPKIVGRISSGNC